MTGWSEGYVADIDYAFSYCAELNPARIPLALVSKGLKPHAPKVACELGFGQGISTAIHAAASDIEWHGTDFNPAQVAFADEIVQASGAKARLLDESFEDYCRRDDLPDFDFIGLHGIWSWVSEHNRSVIVDFLRRKLKPGGIVYMGYNCAAGWSSFVPMRDMMKTFSEAMVPASQGAPERIAAAVGFAERFLAANPAYAAANPAVTERIGKIRGQDPHYLAHEYFCQDWAPMPFSSMPERLQPAKLTFAASARYLDHIDGLNLAEEQVAFLNEVADPTFREVMRDAMIARRFRFDYWLRGPRQLSTFDHAEALRTLAVVLVKPRSAVPVKVQNSLRDAEMQETIYQPVLDVLADNKPHSVAEIESAVRAAGLNLIMVIQALLVLAGDGHVAPAQDQAVSDAARSRTDRLNARFLQIARDNGEITYLASPVTGGGIHVGRLEQLFLGAITEGRTKPDEWVDHVWPILAMQGHLVVKDGVRLEAEADNKAELLEQATGFAEGQLPVLRALQVC